MAADITACPSGTRALVMAIIEPFRPRLPACRLAALIVGGQFGGRRAPPQMDRVPPDLMGGVFGAAPQHRHPEPVRYDPWS